MNRLKRMSSDVRDSKDRFWFELARKESLSRSDKL